MNSAHEGESNEECAKLAYNTRLNRIIRRSEAVIEFTNHQYLSYNQLKSLINSNNRQINLMKLNSLNLRRENLSLRNKNNDMMRMVNLIANNEIARVNVILKVCLKQNFGVNAIIERLSQAIAQVYKCKSYSANEVDAGVG